MRPLDRILSRSRVYEMSRRAIGAHREMERIVAVAALRPGSKVLDFGCGNGRLLGFLPDDVDYTGVDNNQSYIDDASARSSSDRVRFVCGDLSDLEHLGLSDLDIVFSIGVLHHLPDDVAESALGSALASLAPGGEMITMDPCFDPHQRSSARVLMALDRGKWVRHPSEYMRLVAVAGGDGRQEIWTDVYRFPYTHCVQFVKRS